VVPSSVTGTGTHLTVPSNMPPHSLCLFSLSRSGALGLAASEAVRSPSVSQPASPAPVTTAKVGPLLWI
jgi:hypothetical protein